MIVCLFLSVLPIKFFNVTYERTDVSPVGKTRYITLQSTSYLDQLIFTRHFLHQLLEILDSFMAIFLICLKDGKSLFIGGVASPLSLVSVFWLVGR